MSEKPKKEKKEKKPKKQKKQKLPKPSNKMVKVCPNCLAEIPKKAKICPSCAAKQRGKVIFLVLPLVLLLLLGAFLSVFGFHFPVDPPFELYIPIISGPKMSETPLGLGMNLTAKQEEAVLTVLGECGFKEVTQAVQVDSDAATTSYAVQDVDTERFLSGTDPILVRLLNEDKTVQSVLYQDKTLYNGEEVLAQVTDYYMDMSERDVYMQEVLKRVKARLDLPEVAVFPSRSHWTFTEEADGVLIVESYVTTKDGSGAETVRPFTAKFENGSFVSLSFIEPEE